MSTRIIEIRFGTPRSTTEAGATERPWRVSTAFRDANPALQKVTIYDANDKAILNHEDETLLQAIVDEHNAHASLVAEVGRLRGATEAALNSLRRFRDEKPKQWDAIVDADACDVWDSLVAALRSGGE